MKHKLTISVVVSVFSCFSLLAVLMHQASASPSAVNESSAAYRYRTSQIAHWRATAYRPASY